VAPLHCLNGGRVEPRFGSRSNRPNEFAERRGHPHGRWGIDAEFVVSIAGGSA
jgi:hypothetical protein